jgi:predicted RNase H-like HicB family nuclease
MKYRAIIKESGDWWIGWLVDLPGVNAQERSKKELLKSLRIGAEDMLATNVQFEPGSEMTTIEVSDPEWSNERLGP